MQDAVQGWLDGRTLIEISEILTRRDCPSDRGQSRTHAGHYVPRAILWQQRVAQKLSLLAGLMLALQNQWVEHDPDSIPDWFANTVALHTFPLGLRFGLKDPFALAWHRHVIQERRAANLLQSLAPLAVESVTDLQEVWQYTDRAKNIFIATRFAEEPAIIFALQRVLKSKFSD